MQQLLPTCLCGRTMTDKDRCPACGLNWEHDKDGHLAYGFRSWIFTPLKLKLNHYQKYMRWRDSVSRIPKIPRGSKRNGSRR
jgi:hypothetical protein